MSTSEIDLTDVRQGDTLTVVLEDGERFENGVVSGAEVYEATDAIDRTTVELTFEGGFWEQVNDRVDDEVLTIRQTSGRGGTPLRQPTLHGYVWEGEVEEMQTPEYVELGPIAAVERHG